MNLIKENTKVEIMGKIGYVSGYGVNKSTTNNPYTVYLVELENGFYNEDKTIYVGTIIVSDNILRIIEE